MFTENDRDDDAVDVQLFHMGRRPGEEVTHSGSVQSRAVLRCASTALYVTASAGRRSMSIPQLSSPMRSGLPKPTPRQFPSCLWTEGFCPCWRETVEYGNHKRRRVCVLLCLVQGGLSQRIVANMGNHYRVSPLFFAAMRKLPWMSWDATGISASPLRS
jgi:hypothetical protein